MVALNTANPFFVRCIKSNRLKVYKKRAWRSFQSETHSFIRKTNKTNRALTNLTKRSFSVNFAIRACWKQFASVKLVSMFAWLSKNSFITIESFSHVDCWGKLHFYKFQILSSFRFNSFFSWQFTIRRARFLVSNES
jgi:hypothetical protein